MKMKDQKEYQGQVSIGNKKKNPERTLVKV